MTFGKGWHRLDHDQWARVVTRTNIPISLADDAHPRIRIRKVRQPAPHYRLRVFGSNS